MHNNTEITQSKKFTEGDLINALRANYIDSQYLISNAYIFRYNWESDFFLVNKSGYSYEFEVKISKADFKNDMKKVDKHSILSSGKYSDGNGGFITHELRPNKFFYCVPENLIGVEDLPSYAGLVYFNRWGGITKIKEPEFIHKERINFDSILCPKFYYHNINLKKENRILRNENEDLRKRLVYFDTESIRKWKVSRVKKEIFKLSYNDYQKFMIDHFSDYSMIANKLHECGLLIEQENRKPFVPEFRYDVEAPKDKYRILTKEEFQNHEFKIRLR